LKNILIKILEDFMATNDSKEMQDTYEQLSASGRLEVLTHALTILKAENGIKKQYGINDKPQEKPAA
jgi:hypothetical protein